MKINVMDGWAVVVEDDTLQQNSTKNYRVEFGFDSSWDGYTKTAIFKAGSVSVTVDLAKDHCVIPAECLKYGSVKLQIGIYGVRDKERKGTIWCPAGMVISEVSMDVGTGFPSKSGEQGPPGEKGDKGDPGETPYIGENGNWWVGETDTGVAAVGADGLQGPIGEKGEDGEPGKTPHIGKNGNWWLGETDTGVTAAGADGQNGLQGPPGEKGEPGINGVAVATTGTYAFNVDENGHLIVMYTGDIAPDFSINSDGHLILNI